MQILEQLDNNVTTNVEEVTEETVAATPEEKLSPKYAQLARKEQALRQRELELKAMEQRLAAKEEEYKTRYVPKEEISKKFSTNFNEAAEEFGLSYDTLTQAVLNQPTPETQAYTRLEKEIQALKQERLNQIKAQEEAQVKAYNQAIENLRAEATQLVETDPEFETIKASGEVEKVVQHIEKTYKETGKVLKVSEAAKVIEEQLLEQAMKLAKLQKVQTKLAPQPTEAQKPLEAGKAPSKTLTNNLTTNRKLSSKERALMAFRGEL